jgi:type IV secretory pathway TraG/TraD family ATPase VirD4
MYSVVNDLFVGAFNDDGVFSMRDFVRKKGGRTLFIEYDLAIGDLLSPIYTLLFDLVLKETLSRNASTAKGNVYLILDELKLLPNLRHLDDGINFGRGLGLKIIAGLQSVDQLNSVYNSNEAIAQNIIAGFSSIISFRLNDAKTREHITKLHGKNVIVEQYQGLDGLLKETRRDGFIVEDWDLAKLEVGEAVVGIPQVPPFTFRFELFREVG